MLRVLGCDPSWFTRTLGALLVVAAGELAWGGELYLSGRANLLAWVAALAVGSLGLLLVGEQGSGERTRNRHRRR